MNLLYLFLLILIIYIIAYGFAYPRYVKSNLRKFFIGDAIISIGTVILIGVRFWETGEEFDFYIFKSNWFIATLLCQAVAESALIYFYNKRYNVLKDMGKPPEKKPE